MLKKEYTIDMLNEKCEQDLSKEILSNYRSLVKSKNLINVMFFGCIMLILFVVFKYPVFLLVMCALAALKYIIDDVSVIHLTYNLSSDCESIIKARLAPLEKAKKSPTFFLYWSNTKFPYEIINSAPWPFKIDTELLCIKSGNEYLLFLPDKLYHIIGSDITAYDYDEIDISEGRRTFPNLCLYNEIVIKSNNGKLDRPFIYPAVSDSSTKPEKTDNNGTMPKKQREIKRLTPPVCVDSHPLQYEYNLEFSAEEGVNVEDDILGTSEKTVDVKPVGDKIHLIYNDILFGHIDNPHKAKMLSDWEEKGLPVCAVLRSDAKCVNLRFFCDKRIGNEWREQSVVRLTSYRGEEKQLENACLFEGIKLDLFEDDYREGTVNVCNHGMPIGNLPAKIARRYLDEGAYLVTVEAIEEKEVETADFETYDVYIPTVRIFWNRRRKE